MVNENYLIDAVNFSDAETGINKEMEPFITGEFSVEAIKKSRINEVLISEGEIMYKARVAFISLDEEKGVEKKSTTIMLVNADNVDQAYKNITELMTGAVTDYEVEGITDSKLMDYFTDEKPSQEA